MEKKTAGELSKEAYKDTTKYKADDLGHGLIDDVSKEVLKCVESHLLKFNGIETFCVVSLLATDCIITNMIRMKYFAMPWLPKPRPNQSCFLYDHGKITHLWSLPNANTMAELSSISVVDTKYQRVKRWCDAFYDVRFWEEIREEYKIKLLSEEEMIEKTPEEYESILSKITRREYFERDREDRRKDGSCRRKKRSLITA